MQFKRTLVYCKFCLAVPFVWAFFTCTNVLGDTPIPPYSYEIKGDNVVFVMLSPRKDIDQSIRDPQQRSEALSLREHYERSGLYRNDGSNVPLWTATWYSTRVSISPDGKYLVRFGPWATNRNNEAISFFVDGKLIRSYKIRDLVKDFRKVDYSVSHFEWECSTTFDSAASTLTVLTLDEQRYRFNLATGRIRTVGKELHPLCAGNGGHQ